MRHHAPSRDQTLSPRRSSAIRSVGRRVGTGWSPTRVLVIDDAEPTPIAKQVRRHRPHLAVSIGGGSAERAVGTWVIEGAQRNHRPPSNRRLVVASCVDDDVETLGRTDGSERGDRRFANPEVLVDTSAGHEHCDVVPIADLAEDPTGRLDDERVRVSEQAPRTLMPDRRGTRPHSAPTRTSASS